MSTLLRIAQSSCLAIFALSFSLGLLSYSREVRANVVLGAGCTGCTTQASVNLACAAPPTNCPYIMPTTLCTACICNNNGFGTGYVCK